MTFDLTCVLVTVVVLFLVYKAIVPPKVVVEPDLLDQYLPYSLVKSHHPDYYNLELPIQIDPSLQAKSVVYWAADGSNSPRILSARQAYNEYANSGASDIDNNTAILRLAFPQPYYLPDSPDTVLGPHVHYRILDNHGRMSKTYHIELNEKLGKYQKFKADQWSYLPRTDESCS